MPGPKVSSAKELPPPIPVRNFRSPKQPTSQDMADLNNFGGGVNPLGYLGHTFTEHGYGPTYSPPVRPPPSAYKQPHRRPQYPSFDFGEDDESTFTAPSPKPPTTSGLPLPPSVTESSPKSCFSLIGPLTPILPECSLSSVGSSTTMSQNIFILWRVFILCMSMAAIIVSIAQNLRYITFLPGVALVFSFLESSIMLRRAVLYRLNHADMYILFNKIKTYGCVDAFPSQTRSAPTIV